MNHKITIIALLAGLVLAGCTTTASDPQGAFERPSFLAGGEQTTGRVVSGTTGQGDVQIELTPVGMRDGAFVVEFASNTHTVDMSQFDLSTSTVLRTNGEEYVPTDVPELRGHHVRGELVFPLNEEPTTYTITITGIPNMPERKFTWER